MCINPQRQTEPAADDIDPWFELSRYTLLHSCGKRNDEIETKATLELFKREKKLRVCNRVAVTVPNHSETIFLY